MGLIDKPAFVSDPNLNQHDTQAIDDSMADNVYDRRMKPEFSIDELRQVERWLDDEDLAAIEGFASPLHASELAALLEKTDPDHRWRLVDAFKGKIDAEVFSFLHDDVQSELIRQLSPKDAAAIVDNLESDDALELVEDLEDKERAAILSYLSGRTRLLLEEGMSFPEESAGRLIQREVAAFPQFWTVGKTIDYLRAAPESVPEDFHTIFVVDPLHHCSGVIDVSQLLRTKRSMRLIDLAKTEFQSISVDIDQEEVAHRFSRYGLINAPVIGTDGRLLGVITIDDVMNVVSEEAEEDILALGGVSSRDIYRAVIDTAKSRFSWLFVNLITAILASLAISMFDATLDQIVALAVLMPIVASMGGNAGTQTLTVAVRALATKELSAANAWRIITKETTVGAINGILFAILMGAVAWFWFKQPLIAVVIALAMIVNLFVAGLFGALIPVALDKLKMDPALASTVFLTTITDIVGFVVFLGLATLLIL